MYLHIIFLLLYGCKSKPVAAPVWVNKSATIHVPADSLVFTAAGNNWNAALLSFAQPVPLNITYANNGFVLHFKKSNGLTEGNAQIMLTNNKEYFFYDAIVLNNAAGVVDNKEYRSPKTVNTDSSLMQQRILYSIDEWRNLVYVKEPYSIFYEDRLQLSPKAGTFEAQKARSITSFYVQPGSPVVINVAGRFVKQKNIFEVTTGLLKDRFNNTVANGTTVTFMYTDSSNSYNMNTALLNGFAVAKIPASSQPFLLQAKVNETYSPVIKLLPQ